MAGFNLERAAQIAQAAADAARPEILGRFRNVAVETKGDGSPVTEADRAAERAIRSVLREATPELGILGEEYGQEGDAEGLQWIVDPIDGTLSYSRGVPLFGTLIALLEDGEPVVGLIDLHAVGERYVAWRGGGASCNGEPVRVSERTELRQAIITHGDPYCFELYGEWDAWQRLAREVPILRGYTDCFGHAMVVRGAADAMLDLMMAPWDAAATRILVSEAGGRCAVVNRGTADYPFGLVAGSPPLVDALLGYLSGKFPVTG